MSEQDQAQERTEQPSPRRLEKARRKGQVARSRELNTALVILAGGAGYLLFGGTSMDAMKRSLTEGLNRAGSAGLDAASVVGLLRLGIVDTLVMLTPIMIAAFVAAIAAPVLLGGFVFSGEAATPKLSRLNPQNGLKRVVSSQGLMELVKTLLKFSILTGLAALLLFYLADELLALGVGEASASVGYSGEIVRRAFIVIASGLLVIALIDVPFQLFSHFRRLRMTRQELKDEQKESEGSPETRARIRRVRQEVASRRMMQEVPLADVVLTNPVHYAVALRYTDQPDRAPRVVAKGSGLIALRIREVAEEHGVAVCESPLLTRAVYFNTEIGDDIPAGLYLAVARVLVWVMNVKAARREAKPPPELPSDLPVPADLRTEPPYAS